MVDPVPLRDFDLLRPIGDGATGRVWYGVHRTTGTPVAVKTLHRFLHDPEVIALFEREARAIASLDHPHVVALLDFGTVDAESASRASDRLTEGAPFLVMEHVSGGTIGAPPVRDEPGLHEVVRVLLGALGHAHSRGVLHRDLKLSNVLRAGPRDLRPGLRLVDFGIAWFARSDDDDLVSVGTPSYMAPEQLAGEPGDLGPWTDLYALASLTWRLVCGAPPAKGDNRLVLLMRKEKQDFIPWAPRFPVPDGLEQVLRRCLDPRPDARPRSAAELNALLDDLPWSSRVELERDRRPPQLLGAGLPLLALRPDEPVGRERALSQLHGALRRVTDGGGLEVVTIEAKPGMDADALVRHFCDTSEEEGPAVAVRLDGRDPDLPARVLRRITGSAELVGDALTERLQRYLASRQETSDLALAVLIDVLTAGGSEDLERQQERERRVIVARVLALEAQRQPLVIVLSGGVGYGRGIGRQLVRLARIEALPVLLVLTEPDAAEDPRSLAPLLQHPRRTKVELPALSKSRLKELADSLLPLQGRLRDRLLDRASGAPETLRGELITLAEQDALVAVRGRFRLRVGVELPPQQGGHARALRRLDAIGGEPGRLVAELLAQLDGPCPAPLLLAAARTLGAEPEPALRKLARAGIAKQTRDQWGLVSAELGAALRLTPQRPERELAEALLRGSVATGARLPAEWNARLLEVAGRHREALNLRIRIIEARERRKDRERAALEITAARALVEVLGLPADHPDHLRLDLLALTRESRTRAPEFVSRGEALAARATRAGQPAVAGEALRLVSIEHRSVGRLPDALLAGKRSLQANTEADEPVGRAQALHTLGLVKRELGDTARALAHYSEALALAMPVDRLVARRLLCDRADLLQMLGRWDEAAADIDQADALVGRNESPRNRAIGTTERLQLVLAQGRLGKVRAMAEALVADLRYLGIDDRLASALVLIGEVYRFTDDLDRAEDHYRQALLMFEALGSSLAILARANLGIVAYARGDAERSFDDLSTLLEDAESRNVAWMASLVRMARAPAAAAVGRWDLVRETVDELEAAAASQGRIDLDTAWVAEELARRARSTSDPERIARLDRLARTVSARLPPRQ